MKSAAAFLPLFTLLVGCEQDDALAPFLPELPPAGGPAVCRTGRLTADNYERERIPGPASKGLPGDYFMACDTMRVVLQQPGRSIAPVPYGGNVIDLDFADRPAGDQFGELGLFLLSGRTANFTAAEIVRDGSQGGPAVLRFRGGDALDDYINIGALGGVSSIIQPELQADNRLGLSLAATYVLSPGASQVEVIYTFYNAGQSETATSWGTITETGGALTFFHPRFGYGELGFASLLSQDTPLTEYMVQQGEGVSYGVVPDSHRGGIPFPIAGVGVEIYDVPDKFGAFNDKGLSVVLPPGQGAERRVHLVLARGGVDGVERVLRKEIRKQPTRVLRGTLGGTAAGETLQVGIADPAARAPYDAYTAVTLSGADGQTGFTTELPAGRYRLQAEGSGSRQGPPVLLDVSVGPGANDPLDVKLELPAPARLDYRIVDDDGQPMPGKISILGRKPPVLAQLSSPYERGLPGLVMTHKSRAGDSAQGTRFDHPLQLAPGDYRVVVSRGPEWTRFEQRLTLLAGQQARVTAQLFHAVPTPGYAACDFHQHSINSPDSIEPLEDRVVSYLAEGVDFISSSDHDVITDYKPIIRRLQAERLLDAVPGDEMTPFGYGHFIAWPLRYDPASPTGGAFDWGGGPEERPDVAPGGIFDAVRKLGAKVLQVNHPRLAAPSGFDFQQNFDRAALTFDFAARTFFGNRGAMKFSPAQLGLPEEAELFSDRFNALEVQNGSAAEGPDRDGERHDPRVERILRDWMDFLSFGFLPTATGTSDSHGIVEPAGVPRSLVRVPDDSPAALAAGIGDEVARTVAGLDGAPKDVIVTNGPFLQLYVDDPKKGGIGRTVTPAGPLVTIVAEVFTPEWAPIDTLEVFANSTFTVPLPAHMDLEPLVPALCFSSRPSLSERCRAALVSGALTVDRVDLGGGRAYLKARIEVPIEVSRLLSKNRAGARGRDLWLVARAFGDRSLYPVLSSAIDPATDVDKLVSGVPITNTGAFPLAFTNPVFLDVDGGGWRGPFQP